MKFAKFLSVALMMMVGLNAAADSLPVITPTSIQINGKEYVPNMTVDSTNITYKITFSVSSMTSLYISSRSVPTSTWYGSLCANTTAECIANTDKKGAVPYGAWSGVTLTGNTTVSPGSNNLQIVVSSKSDQFFGSAATGEQVIGSGGNVTIKYVVPGKQTLSVNGNALAASDAIPASTNQSVSASVTVSSDDTGKAGQVYVAAYLPATPGIIYLLASDKKWVSWNPQSGKTLTPYYVGALSSHSVDLGALDLSAVKGATLYVGYGVGTADAADKDVLTGKYSFWTVK